MSGPCFPGCSQEKALGCLPARRSGKLRNWVASERHRREWTITAGSIRFCHPQPETNPRGEKDGHRCTGNPPDAAFLRRQLMLVDCDRDGVILGSLGGLCDVTMRDRRSPGRESKSVRI